MTYTPAEHPPTPPLFDLAAIFLDGVEANKKFPLAFPLIAPAMAHALLGSPNVGPTNLSQFALAQIDQQQQADMQQASYSEHKEHFVPLFPAPERYAELWLEYKRNTLSLIARLGGILNRNIIEGHFPEKFAGASDEAAAAALAQECFAEISEDDWNVIRQLASTVYKAVSGDVAQKVSRDYLTALTRLFKDWSDQSPDEWKKMLATGAIPGKIRTQVDAIIEEHMPALVALIINDLITEHGEHEESIRAAFAAD